MAWAGPVAADPGAPAAASKTAGDDTDVQLQLQAARRELLALVAREAAALPDRPGDGEGTPSIRVGVPAPSMTSAAPAARTATSSRAAAPRPMRLDWLEGLQLPDIPVRWDDRLVRMLEYYRTDSRGQALMRGLLTRKGRFAALLRAKLKAARLPEDLAYVVMVESGFDPRARSEVGALGLWQLMQAPAGAYGLEMTRWVDERMNVDRSTDVALQFLSDLHGDLGSWPLALAAYNMGSGALLRSIQKYNTNDFWLLANLEAGLPFETVTYVTKVSAFAIIGRNPGRFGLGNVEPDTPIDTVEVALPGGTSLARVARAAGISLDMVTGLNPELKRNRLPPDVKTWNVRIPRDRLERIRSKWASSGSGLPPHRTHVLRLGERMSEVAEMYGTTLARLYRLNDFGEGADVRPGTRLRVPDVEPQARDAVESAVVGVPADRFTYGDRKRVFYRVASGDDLREIAQFFRVTPEEIQLWNRVASDCKLQRGMFLQLYVPRDADLSQTIVLAPNEVRTLVVGSEEFFDFHETQQNRRRIRYRVKPGDTLQSLARRFDLSVGSIARINRFSRSTKLRPNSEIIVYVSDEKTKKTRVN